MKRLIPLILVCATVLSWISCVQGDKKIQLQFKYGPDAELSYEQVSKRLVRVSEADSVVREHKSEYGAKVTHLTREVLNDSTVLIAEKVTWWYEQQDEEDAGEEKDEILRGLWIMYMGHLEGDEQGRDTPYNRRDPTGVHRVDGRVYRI